jgi:hypothetical protein
MAAVPRANAESILSITVGNNHTCALTSVGGVKCWGGNELGQLGDRATTHRSIPVDVIGPGSGVKAFAAGAKYWGDNDNGQLEDSTTESRLTSIDVIGKYSLSTLRLPSFAPLSTVVLW